MKYLLSATAALLLTAGLSAQMKQPAWTVLFDGSNLDNWTQIGNANWKFKEGAVEASGGNRFFISKSSYKNFELRAEFWVDEPANSGVYLRCTNPREVTADNAYEVNIYDTRPDQTYATGSIVSVSPPWMPMANGTHSRSRLRARISS